MSQILTCLITQLILRLNSLRNSILKTALSLFSSRMLKDILILYPLIFTLTGPISIYMILFLYIIGSPKMVINKYRFFLSLYNNPILLTANSNIQFLVTLLSTSTLNFLFCYLAYRFKYQPIFPLRV